MRTFLRGWALLLGLTLQGFGALAHDARPAYLELRQSAPERYELLWRMPVLSGMPLPVAVELPAGTRDLIGPRTQQLSDSLVERRTIEVPGGLAGRRIGFPGLQATITDVVARVQTTDTGTTTSLVKPAQPWVEVTAAPGGPLEIAGAFVRHGIEHILGGYDHLLFVFALIVIVRSTRVLVWTITAFTLAHSITLAMATLGVVHVPGPPVEAAIAFSIVLLASEIVRLRRNEPSLTARQPWVVAFCFGLLHGFGFAGALSEIGLPQRDIPLALFAFNVGVELGQLAFVGAVLGAAALLRRLPRMHALENRMLRAAPYAIGALAGFWFIERVSAFWI